MQILDIFIRGILQPSHLRGKRKLGVHQCEKMRAGRASNSKLPAGRASNSKVTAGREYLLQSSNKDQKVDSLQLLHRAIIFLAYSRVSQLT
jgi:hypothetical protein